MKRLVLLLILIALSPVAPRLVPVAQATDYDVVNEDIWPSQNDVALTPGNGKKLLENQWANLGAVFTNNNYSLTGLTVPGSSASLNINVAAGTAYLAGRWISIPGATTITATASATNYVFLKFVRDGSNLAIGAKFEVNTTGTAPADATPIATLVTSGSAITSTTDKRIQPTTIEVLTSGTTWTFPAGITRVYAEVYGAGGGGGGGGGGLATNFGTPFPGGNGGAGGGTGATNFSTLTATGGAGGAAGTGGGTNSSGSSGAANGGGSGGSINLPGAGLAGGAGGTGGAGENPGTSGSSGGVGGYSAGFILGSVGSTISYAIGAGGAAGTGGSAGVAPAGSGGSGAPGQSGRIVIHY